MTTIAKIKIQELAMKPGFRLAWPIPAAGRILRLFLTSLFLMLPLVPSAPAQVRHLNFGTSDRISECLGRILKRKVLLADISADLDASICEGETVEGLLERLKAKNVDVLLNDQWAVIGNSVMTRGVTKIIVEPQLSAPTLTKDQQARLQDVLIAQSRFIPVNLLSDVRREADKSLTAHIPLRYQVHVLPGETSELVRMVVLLRQFNYSGRNRLALVELRGGAFSVKWDSGELEAESVGIELDDVVGDGSVEIVAMGERAVDIGTPKDDVLAVFEVDGNELTRQEECFGKAYFAKWREEMVCPIEGSEISFITDVRPWQIEVSGWLSAPTAKTTTFKLITEKKRYVAVRSTTKPPENKTRP
jgi:hypothetical protein